MKPSVGRIVHYVSEGSPVREDGTQKYLSQCIAAVVTQVNDDDTIGLYVMNPLGTFHHLSCIGDFTEQMGGTWHWPERVE